MIRSSWPVAMASSVAVTPPSTEFSMGTMAASAEPSRTLSSAVLTLDDGMRTASAASGTCISAASVKVPSGPRKVYVTGDAGIGVFCGDGRVRAELQDDGLEAVVGHQRLPDFEPLVHAAGHVHGGVALADSHWAARKDRPPVRQMT